MTLAFGRLGWSPATLLRAVLLAFLWSLAGSVSAQDVTEPRTFRPIPGCGAMVCEDGHLLAVALDAVLLRHPSCGRQPPYVLNRLYLTPGPHRPVPLGTPVTRAEDASLLFLRRYWRDIQLVDSAFVATHEGALNACLIVLSVPIARRPGTLRAEVVVWDRDLKGITQYFVRLEVLNDVWRATRVEVGAQS